MMPRPIRPLLVAALCSGAAAGPRPPSALALLTDGTLVRVRIPSGTILVRTAQPLGSLAAYLLEPQSADGLATWNYFDEELKEGRDFPVCRVLGPTPK